MRFINSTMDGCFGIAPASSSFCTIDTAFAPVPAAGAEAELPADGAPEVAAGATAGAASVVCDCWLDGDVGASGVSVGCVVTGADTTGAGAGVTGVATADVALTGLIGLTGLVGLVGFVADFTQVFDDVAHEPHTGCPYGSGQVLTLVCVMMPVYPAWQASVCVCALGRHVGGFHLHESCVSCHGPQTGEPYGSGQVLWRAYALLPLWFWRQASWRVSWLGWQEGAGGV